MKFAVATVAFWISVGLDPTNWRKSLDGKKAICHVTYAEKKGINLYATPGVDIYDSVDTDFESLLRSPEWIEKMETGDPDSFSLLNELNRFETKINTAVSQKTTETTNLLSPKIEANKQDLLAAKTQLDQKTEKNKQDIAKTDTKLEGYITTNDKDKLSLTAQLAEKVGGGNKAELENLSSTVLSAIEGGGGTSFNLLSIPQNRSVTPEKTTFLNKSTNLFSKSTVIDDKMVGNNGTLIDDANYVLSDFIPVNAGQTYIFKHAPWGGVWYTESKTYIAGDVRNPQTAPPNSAYFRMGIEKVKVDTQQMNEGNILLPYESFHIKPIKEFEISGDNIRNKSIPITKMDFYKIVPRSKNKFNKNDQNTLIGKFISVAGSEGAFTAIISDNAEYAISHYIEVEGNVGYINTSLSPFITNAFFDENFVCVGRTSYNVFTTPANAKYIRVNLLATELDTAMVYVNDGTVLDYIPYTEKYQLSENIIVSEQNRAGADDDADYDNLHTYKRIYSISDAITEWKKGAKFPVAFMGDSTTDGATVTGNINNTVDTIGTDHIEPNAYPYLLEQKLKAYTGNQNLRIYNAGFSGWNTSRALTHFSQIFSPSSAYGDVKMIGFVYGINDRPLDLELIKSNLIKLCVASYKNGIQPFIVTPQIILQGSSDFTNVQTATQLATVIVRFLKDFAKTYNLELIDMNRATTNFIANAEIPIDSILADTLHFGDEGHKFEAGFLYSQFIGDTIEVTDDMEVSATNPYTHYTTSRAGFFTEAETFRRYANFNNTGSDTLYIRAEILNSTNRKLILTLDVSASSNFYFMVDGVKKLPTDLIELEIGHHRVEVYAGVGTTGKYYGFKLNKKL